MKLKVREGCNLQPRETDRDWLEGSNTTRSRLVALGNVPFTRIPGLLAHGRFDEALLDSLSKAVACYLDSLLVGRARQGTAGGVVDEEGQISRWAGRTGQDRAPQGRAGPLDVTSQSQTWRTETVIALQIANSRPAPPSSGPASA